MIFLCKATEENGLLIEHPNKMSFKNATVAMTAKHKLP
jgi:hypothetical protein